MRSSVNEVVIFYYTVVPVIETNKQNRDIEGINLFLNYKQSINQIIKTNIL